MNQIPAVDLRLREFMDEDEGWGRQAGRLTFQRLMNFVEHHPGVLVFRVSLAGVRRVDISFASETIVQLARRYRGEKGFCFIDLIDIDQRENFEAAAQRAKHWCVAMIRTEKSWHRSQNSGQAQEHQARTSHGKPPIVVS